MVTSNRTTPEAIWDNRKQTCYDPTTYQPLPNYEGLVLFTPNGGRVMVMNTWLESGVRRWDLVCMGWYVPNRILNAA